MNYFTFKAATNTAETGPVYPQVQKMASGYDYKAPNSVHALSKAVSDLPPFSPNLNYFVLSGKAKLTDLLSVSVVYGGFLINEKLRSVFERFNLPKHKFYPATVSYKNNFYEYYWMHIICDLTDDIDYPKSLFYVYLNYTHNLGYLAVSSKEDLEEKKQKVKENNPHKVVTIWGEKIFLQQSFNKSLDLFQIGSFSTDVFITDKLKKAMEKQNITGCDIAPATTLAQ